MSAQDLVIDGGVTTNIISTNNDFYSVYVGQISDHNTMVVSNGGQIANTYGHIGWQNNTLSNTAIVTGDNSLWVNTYSLDIGTYGSSSALVISNNGTVMGGYGLIGASQSSSNNSVTVTGSGSKWINTEASAVGDYGSGNSLSILDGAVVSSGLYGTIGHNSSASNNFVTVSGIGSTWSNSTGMYVGNYGSSNAITISNGGTVINQTGTIGENGGSNNIATVTGSGSLWSNSANLYVGHVGSGNSLIIEDGASVVNQSAYIGSWSVSSNNSVLVNGTGSQWKNNGNLTVGEAGSGTLTVGNGANITASGGISIGSQSGSLGTLNIGSLGGNDTAGVVTSPTIAFGGGSGTINFNQIDATTVSATISGAGSINQLGTGTTVLTGSNSYTGATTVNDGTLLANNSLGSAVGTGSLTVNSGGTLGGNGTIGAATTVRSGGNLTAGSGGIGALTFNNELTLTDGATTTFTLFNVNTFTSINVIGSSVQYGGDLVFNFISFTPSAGEEFALFNMSGGAIASGDFSTVQSGSLVFTESNGVWSASDNVNNLTYQFSESTGTMSIGSTLSVPEPSTYALFGLGALVMGIAYRRRAKVA